MRRRRQFLELALGIDAGVAHHEPDVAIGAALLHRCRGLRLRYVERQDVGGGAATPDVGCDPLELIGPSGHQH